MNNFLIANLYGWPLLSIIVHLVISDDKRALRNYIQFFLVLVWVVFSIILFFHVKSRLAIFLGGWPAPFGITLVFDKLSTLMLCVFSMVAFCISVYSAQDLTVTKNSRSFYLGFWLLLLGITGALFTADIFNLYVWFEVMLVSAFILLSTVSEDKYIKVMHYALINIFGTLLMLLAIALLYGKLGSLNYASIALQLQQGNLDIVPILGLLFFAMAIKSAIFPLYFWLPKAYPQPGYSSIMLMSSLITKVVMVVMLRLVWLWDPLHSLALMHVFLVASWATMFFGVMGAANQFYIKKILSFHIISQLGYILLAISIPTHLAIMATLYFLIHNVFVKTNLFMISGEIERQYGTDYLPSLGELAKSNKYLTVMFLIAAMSLAGFPPLSGFWAKFLVISAALHAGFYVSAGIAVFVSLFTLYSMFKIWRYVFSEKADIDRNSVKPKRNYSLVFIIASLPLLVIPILMGVFPDYLLHRLDEVAQQLYSNSAYIQLILGK